jgi:hypothetical protein
MCSKLNKNCELSLHDFFHYAVQDNQSKNLTHTPFKSKSNDGRIFFELCSDSEQYPKKVLSHNTNIVTEGFGIMSSHVLQVSFIIGLNYLK